MLRRPLGDELLDGAVAAVAVDDEDPAKAAVRHAVEDVAYHGKVGLDAQRDRARELAKIGRDPVRHDGEYGNAERLGGFRGDALGEDAIDGEPQMAVLFGAAERENGPVIVLQVLLGLHPVHVADAHLESCSGMKFSWRTRQLTARASEGRAIGAALAGILPLFAAMSDESDLQQQCEQADCFLPASRRQFLKQTMLSVAGALMAAGCSRATAVGLPVGF